MVKSRFVNEQYYSRYYSDGIADGRLPFGVVSLGFNKCVARLDYSGYLRRHPSRHRFDPKRGRTLDTLVVVHIVSGHGFFRSAESGEIPVPANSIFFVFPGVNHYYRYDDETGWDEEWMELRPEAALPVLRVAGITPQSPLRTFSSASAVAEAFHDLFDASREDGSLARLRVDAIAHRIVAEAVVIWQKCAGSSAGEAIERMRQALLSKLEGGRSVREAARQAGRCESRMRELFRVATGLSPKKFQMRARLVRAGKLLRETDLPVSAVAEETGFGSVYSFSRRFSKLLGCSPTEYRRQKKEKRLVAWRS